MDSEKQFQLKKAQIENYLKARFRKKFGRTGRISVRKRRKFMEEMSRKVGEKFGKDVLFLVDFSKGGFVSLVSPARTESTDKGKLFRSFAHPQVFYTTHCVERFSERTDTTENCIITLDAYMSDALLTYGECEGYLTCPAGVFAYEVESERLIIKTYINYELLSDEQKNTFYGPGMGVMFPEPFMADDIADCDFILADEYAPLPKKS